MDTKYKSVTSNAKNQNTKRDFSTLSCNPVLQLLRLWVCCDQLSKSSQSRQSSRTTCNKSKASSSFTIDHCCRHILWSSTPSSFTADTKPSQSCH